MLILDAGLLAPPHACLGCGCEGKPAPLVADRGAESIRGNTRVALVSVLSPLESQADGLVGGKLFSRLDFWLVLCVGEFKAQI